MNFKYIIYSVVDGLQVSNSDDLVRELLESDQLVVVVDVETGLQMFEDCAVEIEELK